MESSKAIREQELAARGYALDPSVRLLYISRPSPAEAARYIFAGSPCVVLGETAARQLIARREAEALASEAASC
jgi:hypothetical protein